MRTLYPARARSPCVLAAGEDTLVSGTVEVARVFVRQEVFHIRGCVSIISCSQARTSVRIFVFIRFRNLVFTTQDISVYFDRLTCASVCVCVCVCVLGTVCDRTSQEDAALPDVIGANTRTTVRGAVRPPKREVEARAFLLRQKGREQTSGVDRFQLARPEVENRHLLVWLLATAAIANEFSRTSS